MLAELGKYAQRQFELEEIGQVADSANADPSEAGSLNRSTIEKRQQEGRDALHYIPASKFAAVLANGGGRSQYDLYRVVKGLKNRAIVFKSKETQQWVEDLSLEIDALRSVVHALIRHAL